MLYHLFEYLQSLDFPGAGVFEYISFRALMTIVTSLIVSMIVGRKIIYFLRKQQIGESVRDLGLEGQVEKTGTPTMGGIILLSAIFVPTLLFAKLDNVYIITMLLATIWLGAIGFIDDYIKVFRQNKKGLAGIFKIIGQIGVGLIVGAILYFHPQVEVHRKMEKSQVTESTEIVSDQHVKITNEDKDLVWAKTKAMTTTIPFAKNNEFNYNWIIGDDNKSWGWLLFIPIVIFIVIAVSNGANMTDGLDGLATGSSAIIGIALAVLAYVSGNINFADYLNVMYIPYSGELVIYISAFVGACIGFLWYNSYPASVFMGDTGSLAMGGIIAVFAISIRKELMIPILCGVFLIENLSVIMQVGFFKYTKKRFGVGKRIFKMAPLHHHFQKLGMHESKIVSRFWIIGVLLAVLTIVTLKLR